MIMQFPPESFDDWAAGYDAETERAFGYPFEGYQQLLARIVEICRPLDHEHILDLGCGTGSLAARFLTFGCQVTGIDFSEAMIAIARQKHAAVHFQVQDVRAPIGGHVVPRYDHIVSAYVFHHFPIEEKIQLVLRLLRQNLNPGSQLVIGDLVFEDQAARDAAARAYPADWDEEYFWMENEDFATFQASGLQVEMERVSFCAAVMKIEKLNV